MIDSVLLQPAGSRADGLKPTLKTAGEDHFVDVLSCQGASMDALRVVCLPLSGDHKDKAASQGEAQEEDAALTLPVLALQIAAQAARLTGETQPLETNAERGRIAFVPALFADGAHASQRAMMPRLSGDAALGDENSDVSTVTQLLHENEANRADTLHSVAQKPNLVAQENAEQLSMLTSRADALGNTTESLVGQSVDTQGSVTVPASGFNPASMVQMTSTSPGSASATLPMAAQIAVPLQHPQWAQALSQQVLQLSQAGDQQAQVAELRLDPPELGPLRVAIQMHDQTAHAVFVSAHAPVREAIAQALPQLQAQLAQAGISLGQTSVHDQQQQAEQEAALQKQVRAHAPTVLTQDSEKDARRSSTTVATGINLIDTFV